MKIDDRRSPQKEFFKLPNGTYFEHSGNYYLKVRSSDCGENAWRCTTNVFVTFESHICVAPLSTTLVIEP